MDEHRVLKHFLIKANRFEPFLIEGEFFLFAKNKQEVKKFFKKQFLNYKIIGIKRIK